MNELVKWDEIQQQIDIVRDINVLKKYHAALASKEFRKQIDGSIQAINKCEKYKIKIEIAFGEHYRKLDDKKDVKSPSSKLTMMSEKQEAQEDIGKSRETINKYARMSSIEKTDELLEQYEAKCNDERMEMSSSGFMKFTKGRPHVSNNSGENEWYTPPNIINAARNIMGSIDLDPASSESANEIVKATNYYTENNNGLEQKWFGNIWLNPPYSQPLIKYFSNAVITKRHEYNQALILVNNATETDWFQKMFLVSDAVCFLRGRVKFIDENGNSTGAPLQGQAILYFGINIDRFKEEFNNIGICVSRI